jgi:lipopolysaccharide transport system permease protein
MRAMRKHRALLVEMTRRELTEQYAGQVLGPLWAIGHPLFQTGLFLFVFAYVLKTKIGGTYDLPLDYTTYLLSGLLPWLGFQQLMTRSCVALTMNSALVKQVVFPIEVLPLKSVFPSLVPELIGGCLLLAYVLVSHGMPPATYLLLPVLIAVQVMAMIGVGFALAALGALLRDLKEIIQIVITAGIYVSPIFYLPDWVPAAFRPLLYLNPFSYMVWCFQDALYFGRIEHGWAWVIFGAGSAACLAGGYRLFRRLRPFFGNVL